MSEKGRKLFGTDGVRGKANVFPMTSEVALALGKGIAYLLRRKRSVGRSKVVIGKDTRRSSYMFENALSSGICAAGAEAILLGPLPTPAIAFITTAMRADAGVVISASHNSFEDNGIKFFDHSGFKLEDELEEKLELLIQGEAFKDTAPTGDEIGRAYRVDDAPGRYIEFLKNRFPKDLNLEGLKIVIDCANGASYRVAPIVLEELGAHVISIGVSPNGLNINDNCGAVSPEKMCEEVIRHGADVGIALDGDADRLVLCDELGEKLDGDQIIAIAAVDLKKKGLLNKDTVVSTVMSNFGLERYLSENGIHLKRVAVGDRYVVETMRQEGLNLGGEPSGHILFLDHSTTGDGLLASLQILAIAKRKEKRLSELREKVELVPQLLINLKIKHKKKLSELTSIQEKLKIAEERLRGTGRLLLRYSGTEPLIRIMVEGENEKLIEEIGMELKEELVLQLGGIC